MNRRYVIKCTVFDEYGEDDYFEIEADTISEAESIVSEHEYEDEDGCALHTEIIDRNVLGTVLPGSRYAKPGVVYAEPQESE